MARTMAEHDFHVHGPHDHALDHAAHSPPDSFAGRLAATTAVLATVGSIFSYLGGEAQATAAQLANDAAIRRTRAVSVWAAYQSASTLQAMHDLAGTFALEAQRAAHSDESRRHGAERERLHAQAEALESEAVALDQKGDAELRTHHHWARATTVLQISIALAAIALLTKRRWLLLGVYGLGGAGMALGVLAWFGV